MQTVKVVNHANVLVKRRSSATSFRQTEVFLIDQTEQDLFTKGKMHTLNDKRCLRSLLKIYNVFVYLATNCS